MSCNSSHEAFAAGLVFATSPLLAIAHQFPAQVSGFVREPRMPSCVLLQQGVLGTSCHVPKSMLVVVATQNAIRTQHILPCRGRGRCHPPAW
jgi:hypothetical protein